jgi:hypothetical protein
MPTCHTQPPLNSYRTNFDPYVIGVYMRMNINCPRPLFAHANVISKN